jgi:hypothetical protein
MGFKASIGTNMFPGAPIRRGRRFAHDQGADADELEVAIDECRGRSSSSSVAM